MKKNILIIALIIFSSCSNETKKNDLKDLNLKGKVKTLKETSFKAILKSGKIIKGEHYCSILNVPLDLFYTFNRDGDIMELNKYYTDGKLGERYTFINNKNLEETTFTNFKDGSVSITTCKYDDYNNLIENKIKSKYGEYAYKYKNKYDDNGNLTETYDYIGCHETYKYDNKGNVLENIGYDASGNISKLISSKYHHNGNILEKQQLYYSDGVIYSQKIEKYNVAGKIIFNMETYKGVLDFKTKYIYNNKGDLTDRYEYKLNQVYGTNEEYLDEQIKYKYDNNKNLVEKKSIYLDGSSGTRNFSYDKKNNWVKCVVFHDNVPDHIIEREIEYYN